MKNQTFVARRITIRAETARLGACVEDESFKE
jgi:hypothetical protein